ncbi:MAG: transglutaminase family protein [Acidimicrobiales bacterium]
MRRFSGWRLRTDHVTTFRYSSPARASYNEVRKSPLTTAFQTALDARVVTTPAASQYAYRDYWGTQVVAFNVSGPHERLVVQGSSLVETHPPADVPDCSWSEVDAAAERLVEYLVPTYYTAPNEELAAKAAEIRGSAASPIDAITAAVHFAYDSLEYVKGVTHVHSPALEALHHGSGVCQDFAHLALTVLRVMGVPARYVSGYVHPDSDAAVGTARDAESHAWIESWAGRWWPLDPTHDSDVGLRHIVVARGRDYRDVPPVKGIYAGSAGDSKTVTVSITRTA